MMLVDTGQPSAALETVKPVLDRGDAPPAALYAAGRAELARGRVEEALLYLYPPTRPSTEAVWIRLAASQDASSAARIRGDLGFALAMIHQAARILRRDRLYSSLLQAEFAAMEILLRLGKAGGPLTLAADADLFRGREGENEQDIGAHQRRASAYLAEKLGDLLAGGGGADRAYDVGIAAEAANVWAWAGIGDLETALAMIGHLRNRTPGGDDSALFSRAGECYFALASARAAEILASDKPDKDAVARVLANFTAAAKNYQSASAGGFSKTDALDQGVVNLAGGGFLLALSEKWNHGQWASQASDWRSEALQRIEMSIAPFDQALSRMGPASADAMRTRWSRSYALELLQEWRPAAGGFWSLMNNSEAPKVLRINAARHWGRCMARLGESELALSRLAAFAQSDAELAFLIGSLAADAGDRAAAYRYYSFAADPENPAVPPVTKGMRQEAAFKAASLALDHPGEVAPGEDESLVRSRARELMEKTAMADLQSPWVKDILTELGRNMLGDEPDGWRKTYQLAVRTAETAGVSDSLKRAMYMLAAEAMAVGGNLPDALDELDMAREYLGGMENPDERRDAAGIILFTADIYKRQGRYDDALRAYANIFAAFPDIEDLSETARFAAAQMLLSKPGSGRAETDQARAILRGVRDQNLANEMLRGK